MRLPSCFPPPVHVIVHGCIYAVGFLVVGFIHRSRKQTSLVLGVLVCIWIIFRFFPSSHLSLTIRVYAVLGVSNWREKQLTLLTRSLLQTVPLEQDRYLTGL